MGKGGVVELLTKQVAVRVMKACMVGDVVWQVS